MSRLPLGAGPRTFETIEVKVVQCFPSAEMIQEAIGFCILHYLVDGFLSIGLSLYKYSFHSITYMPSFLLLILYF